jgi:GNAT superfamily N-acetyltransferase
MWVERLYLFLSDLHEAAKKIPLSRAYFRHEGDSLYFRCGLSPAAGGRAIILSSVDVADHHQRRGRFSRYLEATEMFASEHDLVLVIELVYNPILSAALNRRHYQPTMDPFGNPTNSFLKKP